MSNKEKNNKCNDEEFRVFNDIFFSIKIKYVIISINSPTIKKLENISAFLEMPDYPEEWLGPDLKKLKTNVKINVK